MRLFNHYLNNTVFLYLQRKERSVYLNYIFLGSVLAFAYALGLVFLVINCFRVFYDHLETLWIGVLSIFVLSSTDNYFQVFKDSAKHILAITIGSIVSIASISIVGRSLWPNVFINLVFFFIGAGFFLTSNFFSFLHAKNMFITYYFMVWLIHFPGAPGRDYFYSPIPQLKFMSVAGISMVVCLFTCLILRYSFATDLYIQNANLLLKQSRDYLKLLGTNLNIQIVKSLNSDRDNLAYQSMEESVFIKIKDELFNETPPDQLICNKLISKTSKSTIDQLVLIYQDYSRLLNKLDCCYKQSKMEFWSKDLMIHLERLQILFERNHKKLYALNFGLSEDFPSNEITKRILPLIPFIETLLKECEYIFCIMSKQLTLRFTHDQNNKEFLQWFNEQHNNSFTHNIHDPINETNINNYNYDLNNKSSNSNNSNNNNNNKAYSRYSTNNKLKFSNDNNFKPINNNNNLNSSLDSILNENKDKFRKHSLEWYQLELNKSFNVIEKTVLGMQQVQSEILDKEFLTDPNLRDSISRVSFFIRGFEKFSVEQRSLSNQIFLLAYHLSLHRFYPQEVKIAIGSFEIVRDYIVNFKKNRAEKHAIKKREKEAFPPNLEPKFSFKERCIIFIDHFLFKRLLFNWLFSLKYALFCSILAVSIYEITLHSRFIFFRNMEWIAIVFVVAYSPIVGALPIVTVLRMIGTLIGGFMGYASLVLMGLAHTRVAQAFIYIGFSFFTIATAFFLVKQQPFEKLVIYVVFGYSVITQFQYQLWTHDIIDALLRMMHICIGLIICAIVGYILPYYDYRQLEKNLYQLPFSIIKSFSFLMSFSFINSPEIANYHDLNNLIIQDQSKGNSNSVDLSFDDYHNSLSASTSSTNSTFSQSLTSSSSSVKNQKQQLPWSKYSSSVFKDNIIPIISTKGLSFQHYRYLMSKVNIELRYNFPIQRSLLLDAKFELMFRKNKFKRIEIIYLAIEQLHNLFGSLDFIISESDQFNLRIVGDRVKDKIIKLLYEINTTSLYLYNIAAFKKDTFNYGNEKTSILSSINPNNGEKFTIDRDNSIKLCNDLINGFRCNIDDRTITQIQHCNAITFILRSFITQYNLVFNLLYDFIQRVNIKKIKTNNLNITRPNEIQIQDSFNYHQNVNEEIKDVRNYQILKILNNKF